MKVKMIQAFGPTIGAVEIPPDIMLRMCYCADTAFDSAPDIRATAEEFGGLEGRVSMQPHFKMVGEEKDFFEAVGQAYLLNLEQTGNKVRVDKSWFVRQTEADQFVPVHHHPGATLSSTGYLSVPEYAGNSRVRGKLEFLFGEPNALTATNFLIKPTVAKFYIWPSYLRHGVYPGGEFTGERVSFSINFRVSNAD